MSKKVIFSRCSSNFPIKFRWFGEPPIQIGDDLSFATSIFRSQIETKNRVFNEYTWAMARVEFEGLVRKASKGKLRHPNEVKLIEKGSHIPLFELRWQNITLHIKGQRGKQNTTKIKVRLYYSEPLQVPDYFIGHHICEKLIIPDDSEATRSLQNKDIDTAVFIYKKGVDTNWGIPELTIPK